MSTTAATLNAVGEVVYPDSDGKPMADNTKQYRYIQSTKGGFGALYLHRPNVFVAGDLLWYPVLGNPKIRVAPDVLVAFGRPQGDRPSYRQWEENGQAPDVVFEILSPGKTSKEMREKFRFYEHDGVKEDDVYDPDQGSLEGWIRRDGKLTPVAEMRGWVSPLTGVRFELEGLHMALFEPNGRRFLTHEEWVERGEEAQRRADAVQTRAELMEATLREFGYEGGLID